MSYQTLGDLLLFYEEFGWGDAVLFLHSHFSQGFWPSARSSSHFRTDIAVCFPICAATIKTMTARHWDSHRGNWQEYMHQTVADWRAHPNLSSAEWQAIVCPALFINGEHDPFGNCHVLQQKCPHACIYEVAGGGRRTHFPMEQAKEINALILEFLFTL